MSDADEMPLEEVTERVDVTELHEPIIREYDEPQDGFEPVPSWMLAVFAVVLFWGGYYLARYSGNWAGDRFDTMDADNQGPSVPPAMVLDTPEKLAFAGRGLYKSHCARCHQDDGQGTAEKIPPLAGADWVTGPDVGRLIGVVLNGLKGPIQVNGMAFDGECPAFGQELRDPQVAAILTFIRSEWGNKADAVFPETVQANRR